MQPLSKNQRPGVRDRVGADLYHLIVLAGHDGACIGDIKGKDPICTKKGGGGLVSLAVTLP